MDISKIILGTGSYDNVKSGNTVSITGDGGNAWGYYGPAYKKLAPRWKTYENYIRCYQELISLRSVISKEEYFALKSRIEKEYIESYYETRLKDLEIERLMDLFSEKYGEQIILLCHEPVDEFCHRRLVADYIELKTGVYIPEVSVNDNKVKVLKPIRYIEQLKELT